MMFKPLAILAFATVMPVIVQQTPPPPIPVQPAIQMKDSKALFSDAEFMQKAALMGKIEVDLAQIAQTRSDNDKVKAAAKAIEADHTAANQQLTVIADRMDVALPGLTDDQKALKEKFRAMSATDFDKAWLAQMVKDHDEAVALFTKGLQASDATIRTFAEQKLPALKAHLKAVKELSGAF